MTLLSCTSVEAGEQWTSYDRTIFLQVGLGFWASKTLLSAVEMEVFTELAKHPQDFKTLRIESLVLFATKDQSLDAAKLGTLLGGGFLRY